MLFCHVQETLQCPCKQVEVCPIEHSLKRKSWFIYNTFFSWQPVLAGQIASWKTSTVQTQPLHIQRLHPSQRSYISLRALSRVCFKCSSRECLYPLAAQGEKSPLWKMDVETFFFSVVAVALMVTRGLGAFQNGWRCWMVIRPQCLGNTVQGRVTRRRNSERGWSGHTSGNSRSLWKKMFPQAKPLCGAMLLLENAESCLMALATSLLRFDCVWRSSTAQEWKRWHSFYPFPSFLPSSQVFTSPAVSDSLSLMLCNLGLSLFLSFLHSIILSLLQSHFPSS